jgi:alpha-amylase/alpha-mannosidase (GH57 family)
MRLILMIVGLLLMLDGTLMSAFGHRYLRWSNFEWAPRFYNRLIDWMLERPDWMMRLAGGAMSSFGLALLRSRNDD